MTRIKPSFPNIPSWIQKNVCCKESVWIVEHKKSDMKFGQLDECVPAIRSLWVVDIQLEEEKKVSDRKEQNYYWNVFSSVVSYVFPIRQLCTDVLC